MFGPLYLEDNNGCWIWQRGTCNGYGWYGRKYAHRVMYEMHIGGLSKTAHLHHKCQNKLCVNPYHLQQLSSEAHLKEHKIKTDYCHRGHPRSTNLVITGGIRRCVSCHRDSNKQLFDKKRQPIRDRRRSIVSGVRQDYKKLTIHQIATKWGVSGRTVYRYLERDPKSLY